MGLTVICDVVAPVSHKYLTAVGELAFKVIGLPLQATDGPTIPTVGLGVTVTVVDAVALQPLVLVTITV
ncbi:MAG: hypothetical protein BWY95_00678 [Bacteroidetes bacterium ADurb.BinA104]|nr:MAG: hypothetical protein BWY95_00678 [Bacteroidetes bacterium ADurb.BinA104]